MLASGSAMKGMKAPKGLENFTLTVNGSATSTAVIGPQLAFVMLGFLVSSARSMVYFTSSAVNAAPSWHLIPSLSLNVTSLPSGLTVHVLARFGTGLPDSSKARRES